jgi:hypothetical protein
VIGIYGGKDMKNATTAFITVDSVNLQLLFLIPVLSFGSGSGGIRRLPKESPEDVCNPSGMFIKVAPSLSSPAFGKITEGYLGRNWFILDNSIDLAMHFKKNGTGLQSFQLRALSNIKIMNLALNRVTVQIQYLSREELQRRQKSRMIQSQCHCPAGYNEYGLCKEPIGRVNEWVQARYQGFNGMTLSVEWNASILWNLISVKDVAFIFATPFGLKNSKPFLVIGGKLNVLFLRNTGAYIDIMNPNANFTISTKISGIFDVELTGKIAIDSLHRCKQYDWSRC